MNTLEKAELAAPSAILRDSKSGISIDNFEVSDTAGRKTRIRRQFVVFKPLSYCFKETIGFEKLAPFARPPVSSLMKPGDITKAFQ